MNKKKKKRDLIIFACLTAVLFAASLLVKGNAKEENLSEVMKDAVLHESNKISLFGLTEVNPALISALTVTCILFLFALTVRIFVIPKFKYKPGKFQILLESLVGVFDSRAKTSSPHLNGFLGGYIFTAGVYIFVGTVFELFGIQAITTKGLSVSLPAPLADINGAVMLGCLSYLIILSGGIIGNRIRGVGSTLKEFSLPISMSFRLFGALLSGALVTELVYSSIYLSFGIPVFVGVMFTLLHALIQAYVLTVLTSLFYGEVSENKNNNITEVI